MGKQFHDLGTVTQLRVGDNAGYESALWLSFVMADGRKLSLKIEDEALRGIWTYLTKILYPRAADQLTQRLETVVRSASGGPKDVTFTATADLEDDGELIMVSGMMPTNWWVLRFSIGEGYDFWTSLEDKLDQV